MGKGPSVRTPLRRRAFACHRLDALEARSLLAHFGGPGPLPPPAEIAPPAPSLTVMMRSGAESLAHGGGTASPDHHHAPDASFRGPGFLPPPDRGAFGRLPGFSRADFAVATPMSLARPDRGLGIRPPAQPNGLLAALLQATSRASALSTGQPSDNASRTSDGGNRFVSAPSLANSGATSEPGAAAPLVSAVVVPVVPTAPSTLAFRGASVSVALLPGQTAVPAPKVVTGETARPRRDVSVPVSVAASVLPPEVVPVVDIVPAPDRPASVVPRPLPAETDLAVAQAGVVPVGADLVEGGATPDGELALEAPLAQLLDEIRGLTRREPEPAHRWPLVVTVVAGAVAFEAARRWRRRQRVPALVHAWIPGSSTAYPFS